MYTFKTKEQAKWMQQQLKESMPRIHHTIIPIAVMGQATQYAVISGKGMYNA